MRHAAVLILFGAALAAEGQGQQPKENSAFNYTLLPLPMPDRTDLQVTLSYTPETRQPQQIGLPKDCYTVPDLHNYVFAFEGLNGTSVSPALETDQRIIAPAPDGTIRLRYRLSFPPGSMDRYSFGPNIGPEHFHVAACQWMLRIGDPFAERQFRIRFLDKPANWRLYWTHSADVGVTELTSSYENIAANHYGGTAGPHRRVLVEGKPVEIFTWHGFRLGASAIADAVERIVRLQRKRMRDNDFPFYHVVTWPRPKNVAGTAVESLFVSFLKPEITKTDLYRNLSHEMFHNWLGTRVRIDPGHLKQEEREFLFSWVHEGLTEHVARQVLLDAGLITTDEFAGYVNRDLIDLADNPENAWTYEEVAAADRAQTWTGSLFKLSYTRGSLIALNWAAQLRRQKRSQDLLDFVRALHAGSGSKGVRLTPEQFFGKAARFGIDARTDFERHVLRGEMVKPARDALGPDFELVEAHHSRYDPGFNLIASARSRVISGVVSGGVADRAGLKDGQRLIRVENGSRFSNTWDPAAPLTITVEDGGKERIVSYWPHGSAVVVPQFTRKVAPR